LQYQQSGSIQPKLFQWPTTTEGSQSICSLLQPSGVILLVDFPIVKLGVLTYRQHARLYYWRYSSK
jgi:hypothetical protein